MENRYTPADYTQDNVLKTPLWLKIILAYQAKYFIILMVLPAIGIIPRLGESVSFMMPYVQSFSEHHANLLLLFPSIPPVLLIVVLMKRSPKTTSAFIRRTWQRGRLLLMGSVVLELVLLSLLLLVGAKQVTELLLVIMYLNAMALIYLIRSQRVKDVFAEFPLTDVDAWQRAKTRDTLQGYRDYLRNQTHQTHEAEAARAIDEILWQRALERDDIESYQTYLAEGIKSKKHGVEARKKLSELNQAMRDEQSL